MPRAATRMECTGIFMTVLVLFVLENYFAQSDVEAQLVLKRFIERGSSVTMQCEHNVQPKILYKVTWLNTETGKFFQYINGRNPPYRNFSIPGAEIDFQHSDKDQVTLKNVDFEASGFYYCEVSTDTPIFTKESKPEPMDVILQQMGPPKITFNRRKFVMGEQMVANCSTYKSRPAPHITWLINGIKVEERFTRPLFLFAANGKNAHRSKSHHSSNGVGSAFDELRASQGGFRDAESTRQPFDSNNGNHYGLATHSSYDSVYGNGNRNKNSHRNHYANNGDPINAAAPFSTSSFSSLSSSWMSQNTAAGSNSGSRGIQMPPTYSDYVDEKYYDSNRKHRNSHSGQVRKNRRHANGDQGSGVGRNSHRTSASSSQLTVDLTEKYLDSNGRVEITCLATIPEHVSQGEQYADYKTFSMRVDVTQPEVTSALPPMSGMAALGNAASSSGHTWRTSCVLLTPTIAFALRSVAKRLGSIAKA